MKDMILTDGMFEKVTIVAASASKKYDGVALHDDSYQLMTLTDTTTHHSHDVVTLPNGDVMTVVIKDTTLNHVGIGVNEVLSCSIVGEGGEDKTCRYNLDLQNGQLSISPRYVYMTSASASKSFDGTPLTKHLVEITGDGFLPELGQDTISCNVTGSQTEAGSSANTFTYTLSSAVDTANYKIFTTEGTLVVAPMGHLLIQTASARKVYDGTPLTNTEIIASESKRTIRSSRYVLAKIEAAAMDRYVASPLTTH